MGKYLSFLVCLYNRKLQTAQRKMDLFFQSPCVFIHSSFCIRILYNSFFKNNDFFLKNLRRRGRFSMCNIVIVIVLRNAFGIVVTLWTKAQLIPVCVYGKKTSKCKIKCVKSTQSNIYWKLSFTSLTISIILTVLFRV